MYKAFSRALLRGNAYVFKELADRGYGKMRESVTHEIRPFADLNEEQLLARVRELENQLGITHKEPELLPPGDANKDTKPN